MLCPTCGETLPKKLGTHCPHCGEDLEATGVLGAHKAMRQKAAKAAKEKEAKAAARGAKAGAEAPPEEAEDEGITPVTPAGLAAKKGALAALGQDLGRFGLVVGLILSLVASPWGQRAIAGWMAGREVDALTMVPYEATQVGGGSGGFKLQVGAKRLPTPGESNVFHYWVSAGLDLGLLGKAWYGYEVHSLGGKGVEEQNAKLKTLGVEAEVKDEAHGIVKLKVVRFRLPLGTDHPQAGRAAVWLQLAGRDENVLNLAAYWDEPGGNTGAQTMALDRFLGSCHD